ncbi:hypothetical protein QJS04_geneDACA000778 [Acorus gramineus]|uniref:Reverse transcriptase domain-containing protein n=1 Tax=Acorus gramineus TaxID=55184 RepID=A0AAV9BF10_ACOGR|nr:hypothetical protein QJS04_geneDACA000778 [Acorus gramineus]
MEADFSEDEVKAAIFGVEADKAPGPDGFGLRFFQEFWECVKSDVMDMLGEFSMTSQGIGDLNATFLVLIPKKEGVVAIEDYRPISLVNGSYKILSKVLANRLKEVIGYLVDECQTAFIPGRLLQDGFMTVQECITVVHKDKRKGIVLKLDFAKAYDNVRWDFLFHLLSCHGVEPNWIRMVKACVTTAKASVLVNGSPWGFFHLHKGLRQGDPLSPLLFMIVVNALSRMVKMAESEGWVVGLRAMVGGSRTSLVQYADDAILLCEVEERSIRGIKFVCWCFELVSGLKINYHESSMSGINVENNVLRRFAGILGCKIQPFPLRHLGLPLHLGRMPKAEWTLLIARLERRLEGWQSRFLSLGGRITLL